MANELIIANSVQVDTIKSSIYEVRGQRVMLDSDLAELYEVEVSQLKRQVRRNIDRFPEDFMFELTREEYDSLRCQNGTIKGGRGQHSKYLPFAFTEEGVAMLSGMLKSKGRDEKIDVPVLFAENNAIDKSFYADAFNFLWM